MQPARSFAVLLGAALASLVPPPLPGDDCNGNGIDDSLDILPRPYLPAVTIPLDSQPAAAVAADLDGDGRPDLALGTAHAVAIAATGGGDTFLDTRYVPCVREGAGGLIAADLDGEGSIDLATCCANYDDLQVLLNDGWAEFTVSPVPAGKSHWDLAAGDLDGDGWVDLVVPCGDPNGTVVLFNAGQAMFEEFPLLKVPGDGFVDLVTAADVDGDGRADLLVGGTERLAVYASREGRTWSEPVVYPAEGALVHVVVADLDGDLSPDLATFDLGKSRIDVHRNDGSGLFAPGASCPLDPLHSASFLTVSDLDGDGRPDLVAGFDTFSLHSSQVVVLGNIGGGFFDPPVVIHPAPGSSDCFSYAWAGDVNGDGKADLVTATGWPASLRLYGPEPAASEDWNGDGVPDECEGLVAQRFRRGDPTDDGVEDLSDSIFLLEYQFLAGPEPACLEAGDADNDGWITLADPIVILAHLFLGGPPPPDPGPPPAACGPDPDPPGSSGDIGCGVYRSCRR